MNKNRQRKNPLAVFMDWEESRYEKTTECTDAIEVINYERPKKQQGRRH